MPQKEIHVYDREQHYLLHQCDVMYGGHFKVRVAHPPPTRSIVKKPWYTSKRPGGTPTLCRQYDMPYDRTHDVTIRSRLATNFIIFLQSKLHIVEQHKPMKSTSGNDVSCLAVAWQCLSNC